MDYRMAATRHFVTRIHMASRWLSGLFEPLLRSIPPRANEQPDAILENQVRPFLDPYCVSFHNAFMKVTILNLDAVSEIGQMQRQWSIESILRFRYSLLPGRAESGLTRIVAESHRFKFGYLNSFPGRNGLDCHREIVT